MGIVAKGTKSPLRWKEESEYGVPPNGAGLGYNELPFNSETFDETINTVQSEDIQSNRENPALRGGNIATRGTLTHDFTPIRIFEFFKHLVAGLYERTPYVVGPTLGVNMPLNRGAYVKAPLLLEVWVVTRGGTTSGVATDLDLFNAAYTPGYQLKAGTAILQYVGKETVPLFKHVITPGQDFPEGGFTFEKGIRGSATPVFFLFTGARIASWDLTVPQEGAIKSAWNFLTKDSRKLDTSFADDGVMDKPVVYGEDFLVGLDTMIHLNDDVGAGGKVYRDFSLNFNNNLDESVFCIGERYRTDLPEGRKISSGKVGMYFLDSTEYDIFKNESVAALAITTIHNGQFWKMEFPQVKLTGSGTPKISGQGAVMQNFDWTAFFQDTDPALATESVKPGQITYINALDIMPG